MEEKKAARRTIKAREPRAAAARKKFETVLGKVGFKFQETMSGLINLEREGERQAQFSLTAETRDIREFARDNICRLKGVISVEGIAQERPVEGTIEMAFWPPKRRMAYDLRWTGDDGRKYRLYGIKRIRYLNFITTITTLQASLYRREELIGKGKVYFPRTEIPKLILSVRPVI